MPPRRPASKPRDDLESRQFWIDQLIATVIAGAGCTIYTGYPRAGIGLFIIGLVWLIVIRLVPLPQVTAFFSRSKTMAHHSPRRIASKRKRAGTARDKAAPTVDPPAKDLLH
jgi:predicted cobalt transporter CbtA